MLRTGQIWDSAGAGRSVVEMGMRGHAARASAATGRMFSSICGDPSKKGVQVLKY